MNEIESMTSIERITQVIYVIRGQRVMLDRDIALLYGVETRKLVQAVKRNIKRFPVDFMFQLSQEETQILRSQIVILRKEGSIHGRHTKYQPYAFTEHGAVMLASVLHSEQAILVSIEVVRAFVYVRKMLISNEKLTNELQDLRSFVLKRFHKTDQEFARLWQSIEKLLNPPVNTNRIGFDLS